MMMLKWKVLGPPLVLAACLIASPAVGHDDHHKHGQSPAATAAPPPVQATVKLRDHDVVDQNGTAMKFARDAVADRIVVISFIYTSCTTVCPVVSGVVANIQDMLEDSAAGDVALVSVSTDPAVDTPERLRRYAERFAAKPGWLWLTGKKPNIEQVLRDLGAYSPDFRNHVPLVLVGDARRGRWSRFYGIPEPTAIAAQVDELRRGRLLENAPKGG
jgi:protein SCO1